MLKEYTIIHTLNQKSYIFVRVVKVMAGELSEQEMFRCNVSSVESVSLTKDRVENQSEGGSVATFTQVKGTSSDPNYSRVKKNLRKIVLEYCER